MGPATSEAGSAHRHGPLWGSRPREWASNEERQLPTYEEAIRRVGIEPGQRVLDLGCGTGVFLRLVADRGAEVFGLDAAERLIDLARSRVPEADLRVGDMQFLPYEDDCFDLVTGFNSFFFTADMVAALREAGRVAKPGATVLIQVWGPPERCELSPMLKAVGALRAQPASAAPAQAPLSRPGVLEGIAEEAGLGPQAVFDFAYAWEYPDDETLVRLMLSAGGVAEAAENSGEDAVREAILDSLASCRSESGDYRIENEWHYLIAAAP